MAATTLGISIAIPGSGSHKKSVFSGHPKSIRFNQSPPSLTAVFSFSRRRRNNANPPSPAKEIHKKTLSDKNLEENDEIDEDAFEALFSQLEEDLKNDDLIGEDGDDDFLSEEELAKLEHELAEALGDDELLGALGDGDNDNEDDKEESDNLDDDEAEDEEEESLIKLKNWQSRRLAYALKNGRRKTSIKNLAAELCLDRAVVLKLLRDPPPNLVMLSAALPDKPVSTSMELEEKIEETVPSVPSKQTPQTTKPKSEVKLPVHEMRNNWSARKRLKKVQIETLELVYGRTKRPTNSMVSSIVYLTNLPRKRVVKWFEDKRAEDEVPDKRLPYHRSAPQTVFTS